MKLGPQPQPPTTAEIEEAGRRIKKGLVDLADHPNLKPLSLVSMVGRKVVDDSYPTACTDGFNEWYNPTFVLSGSYRSTVFLVAHEGMHKYLRHMFVYKQLMEIDSKLANIVMDFAGNLVLYLADVGINKMEPFKDAPPLLDERVAGWSVARLFQWCQDKADGKAPPLTGTTVTEWAGKKVITLDDIKFTRDKSGGGGGSSGKKGGNSSGGSAKRVTATNKDDGSEVDSVDRHIGGADVHGNGGQPGHEGVSQSDIDLLDRVIQSSELMSRMGSNTGGRGFQVNETEFDWRHGLDDWARQIYVGGSSETWVRPNRKYMAHGIYMPASRAEVLPPILLAIDASGSIGTESLSQVVARVHLISEQYRVQSIHVVYWDSEVVGHEIYDTDSFADVATATQPKGGGGTNPSCVAAYINGLSEVPHFHGVIVFTDGYVGGDWGDWSFADNRVLWIIDGHREATPSVGTVLHKD